MLRHLSLMLLAGLLVTEPALAKNNKQNDSDADSAGEVLAQAVITAAEIAIISAFVNEYGAGAFGAPQGLPPGIAKNLARGKPLPPGIAKRYLPNNLLTRLPPRPGYEWLVLDNDILLVLAATSVIVDVLDNAF